MESSPLRHLSGELRNIIYGYLWPDEGEVVICLCGGHHPLQSHLRDPKADINWTYGGSHLPKVCRQLRYEALGYFYNVNSFVLPLQYVLQAGNLSRLEAQWARFVQVFGVEVVRQIKHMTVLAGKIGRIAMVRPPLWDSLEKATKAKEGLEVISEVDLRCVFARRFVRPCLHPAAHMLVLVEHHFPETRSWIDFDDADATIARIREAIAAEDRDQGGQWIMFWPYLLTKWYGGPMVEAGKIGDAV